MAKEPMFGEVLDAVEQLSLDDQETLAEIVRLRVAQRRRRELAEDVREAREEFAAGRARPMTPDKLMDEIES